MKLDNHLIFAALCVFVRVSSMLLSSPILSTVVPTTIKILFGVVLTLSMTPVLQSHIGPVPADIVSLTMTVFHEVLVGLLIGGFLQLLVSSTQAAGSFLDVQIGTASAQIFNPMLGTAASPVSQLKVMLTTVLILLLNGHRMMIAAFVKSYSLPGPELANTQHQLLELIGQTTLLSLQIAAPVAAVSIIIDLAAGIVNKAVPQTQPFLLSLPAKLATGIVMLAIGLPALVIAVQNGLDFTFMHLGHVLRGS